MARRRTRSTEQLPACPVCRAADLPGFVAFELGFAAGARVVAKDIVAEFVTTLCERHAASMLQILRPRVTR